MGWEKWRRLLPIHGNLPRQWNCSWRTIRDNKLMSNMGIYLLGSLVQKAAQFLLIPLYISYFSPAEYGISGITLAVEGFLSMLVGLSLQSAIARQYYEYKDDPESFKSYITTNLLFLSVFVLTATLVLDHWGEPFWGMIAGRQVSFSPYIRLAIWLAGADVMMQIPLVLYRTSHRATAFVVAQFILFLVSTTTIIMLVVVLKMGVRGQLIALLIAYTIITVILIVLLLRDYISVHVDVKYLRMALSYSLPLIPHSIASWTLVMVDRVLLETGGVSLDKIGVYNLAYQLSLLMSVLVFSIHQAWSPYYYQIMKEGTRTHDTIKRMILLYIAGVGGLCLFGILFGGDLVVWMAPSQYKAAQAYMPPILLGHLFLGFYYLSSLPLFYYNRTREIPIITLVSSGINILLNLWWIPLWGAMGSAFATLLGYFSMFLLALFFGFRQQRIELPLGKILVLVGIIVLATSFFSISSQTSPVSILYGFTMLKIVVWLSYIGLATLWLVRPSLVDLGSSKEVTQ